jgi:outer membrane lipoprotein-sorting protein
VLKHTICWAIAFALPVAAAAEPATMTVEDIQACVERSGPQRSSIQRVLLRTTDKRDTVKESRAEFYWEKFDDGLSKVLVHFSAPLDLRGSALLILEKKDGKRDMFMYLPELDRVRRVTSHMMSGSMFGTDFSYAEFERLYGLADDVSARRLPDQELDGEAVYVTETTLDPEEGSSYDRVLVYIEQERCVPVKMEFLKENTQPGKVLTMDPAKIRRVEPAWVPGEILMRDLQQGTQTTLVLEEVQIDVDIPRSKFSERELTRAR